MVRSRIAKVVSIFTVATFIFTNICYGAPPRSFSLRPILQTSKTGKDTIGNSTLSSNQVIPFEKALQTYSEQETFNTIKLIANISRKGILEMLFKSLSGHPGGSLSAADILATLYFGMLRHDPNDPKWENRDRVVLSKGHAAPGLYAILSEAGYFSKDEFQNLRQDPKGMLQGHIDMTKTPGVDLSTGALGQGFSSAVGMAAGARLLGKDLHTWAILGGGEEQEGQISEAARHAVALGLTNLTVIYDDNGYQIEGEQSKVDSADVQAVWRSYGWNVINVDGHDPKELFQAMRAAKESATKPTFIMAKTKKGAGVTYFEKHPTESHGAVPEDKELQTQMLREVKNAIGKYSEDDLDRFKETVGITSNEKRAIDKANAASAPQFKPVAIEGKTLKVGDTEATRVSFGEEWLYLGSKDGRLVAMSADLGPSNKMTGFENAFGRMSPDNPSGRYIALGIREAHGASFAAGLALMGLVPAVGTFDIFILNMLPQMRVIIQNGIPVIFIATHPGVGVGGDGLTHQGVESPGVIDILSGPLGDKMDIFEPGDGEEARLLVELAAKSNKPVYIRLTRQDLPVFDKSGIKDYTKRLQEGSYVLSDPGKGKNDLIIIATGGTVNNALEASQELKSEGYNVKVINVVSLNKIDNEGNPFATYLEDGVSIITVCDAYGKVLENPVLRAINEARKKGANPGTVHAKGVTILGSAPWKKMHELNKLDVKGIKVAASATLSSNQDLKVQLAQLVEGIDTKLAQATRETGTLFSFDPTGKNNDVSSASIDERLRTGVLEVTFNPNNFATWVATDTTGEVDEILSGLTGIADPKELLFEFTKIKVKSTADKLRHIWEATRGKRGYVSVEHDPTIEMQVAEEMKTATPQEREDECVRRILEEVKALSEIAPNVLVKIRAARNGISPYTGKEDKVGVRVVEEATALGINTNYTVVTTEKQSIQAGHAVKSGKERAKQAGITKHIESRISPFLSRLDGYTKAHREDMSSMDYSYGLSGVINGYQIVHALFREFGEEDLPQTPIISSVGVKTPDLVAWAYMYVFTGAPYIITAPENELMAYENSPVPVESTIVKPLVEILTPRFAEMAPTLADRAQKESLSNEQYINIAIGEWNRDITQAEKTQMWNVLDQEGDTKFTTPYLTALETFKTKIDSLASGQTLASGEALATRRIQVDGARRILVATSDPILLDSAANFLEDLKDTSKRVPRFLAVEMVFENDTHRKEVEKIFNEETGENLSDWVHTKVAGKGALAGVEFSDITQMLTDKSVKEWGEGGRILILSDKAQAEYPALIEKLAQGITLASGEALKYKFDVAQVMETKLLDIDQMPKDLIDPDDFFLTSTRVSMYLEALRLGVPQDRAIEIASGVIRSFHDEDCEMMAAADLIEGEGDYAIGGKVGGTSFNFSMVDKTGRIVSKGSKKEWKDKDVANKEGQDLSLGEIADLLAEEIIDMTNDNLDQLLEQKVVNIGISVPGQTMEGPGWGRIAGYGSGTPNLAFRNSRLAKRIEDIFAEQGYMDIKIKVHLINDSFARLKGELSEEGTLGENGWKSGGTVISGTGVNWSMAVNGEIFTGAGESKGALVELGNTVLVKTGSNPLEDSFVNRAYEWKGRFPADEELNKNGLQRAEVLFNGEGFSVLANSFELSNREPLKFPDATMSALEGEENGLKLCELFGIVVGKYLASVVAENKGYEQDWADHTVLVSGVFENVFEGVKVPEDRLRDMSLAKGEFMTTPRDKSQTLASGEALSREDFKNTYTSREAQMQHIYSFLVTEKAMEHEEVLDRMWTACNHLRVNNRLVLIAENEKVREALRQRGFADFIDIFVLGEKELVGFNVRQVQSAISLASRLGTLNDTEKVHDLIKDLRGVGQRLDYINRYNPKLAGQILQGV